jgi:hypothetical protein
MNYNLKDKIQVTKDFLNELEAKSWQEIEYLQSQIANIEATTENIKLIQLFKNLLTNYYVFVGGLENLASEESKVKPDVVKEPISDPKKENIPEATIVNTDYLADLILDEPIADKSEPTVNDYSEPFEYFVDFDEPIGDPLTDDDLYNN